MVLEDKIQICFTKNQLLQLKDEKERLGSSINSIVRLAVARYFETLEGN